MTKYVKNQNTEIYNDNEFDADKAIKAAEEIKKEKKRPTSIALDPKTISKLKDLAERKGIPYQVLMRSFILDGLDREDKESA
jgi:predicted DNA binding CopG/RHH family protein